MLHKKALSECLFYSTYLFHEESCFRFPDCVLRQSLP
jgi:hypothetical protein